MSESKFSRREILALSGKAMVALGGGIVTVKLLPGCGDDDTDGGPGGDTGISDTDDTGYENASFRALLSRAYASAE